MPLEQQVAEGFSGPNDPWRQILGLAPVKVSSQESLKNLMSTLGGVQTSRSGLKALGKEVKPKTKRGFISAIFNPEKGLLFAPSRAVSAGVADVLGLAQDTELSEYNPLESAFRAGKGEFAVTGGDIIRTEESDSVLERTAKLGGAFAWDVFTDPLNYVGGSGVFARKGLLAATLGDDALRRNIIAKLEVNALAKKPAEEVSTMLNKLASNTREVAEGKFRIDVAGTIVDETGTVLSKEIRDGLAARSLANTIADGFVKQGRSGVVQNLTKVIGDADIAKELFQSLDREFVGGLFLKNPITGKPIARIAGGKGKGNIVTDAANQLRFRTSSGASGRWGSRDLSGRFGPTYAAYKYGLLTDNFERLGVGRTLFTDFTDYKNQARLLKTGLALRLSKLHAAQSHILRARNKLSKEDQELFDKQIKYFYHNPTDALDDAPLVSRVARDAAQEIRANINDALDEFRELNIKLGYQEDFVPLMYSDEYIDFVMKYDPKTGAETRGRYRGNLKRDAYTSPLDAADVDVFGVETSTKLSAKSPLEANDIANPVYFEGKKIEIFETDPVKILERYTEWAARTTATERFVKGLEAAGVMLYLPAKNLKNVNAYNAVAMAEAIGKATTEGGKALREELRRQKDELKRMVSGDTIRQREAQRAGMVSTAQAEFDQAETRLVEASAYLRDLNRQLVEFEPNVKRLKALILNKDIRSQLRVVDEVQRTVDNFARDVQNAKSRLSRAADNADLSSRQKKILEDWTAKGKLGAADALREVKKEAAVDAKRARQLEQELTDELEDLRDVQESLASLKNSVDKNAEFMATGEFETFVKYLNVLEEKNAVYRRIQDAYRPARVAAKNNLSLLNRDIALPRADAIRQATFTYVELRRQHLRETVRIRGIAPKARTVADKNRYKASSAALKAAKKDMQDLISDVDPSRATIQTAGRAYAREIFRMADKLSNDQFVAAFAFSDARRLDTLIATLNDPNISHAVRMQAYGDMMASYRNMRQYVGEDQLRTLNNYERQIYNEPDLVFETRGDRFTAKINVLRDDMNAAINRNDLKEVERLRDEIDKIEALTQEDGLRLIGAGKVKVPQSLEDMYAPMGVRQVMERFYQLERNTSEWESFIGKVYDPLSLVWKTAATVGRGPAYTFTNIIGGLVNNWLGGVSAKHHALAGKIIYAYDKGISEALAKEPDLATALSSGEAVKNVRRLLGDLKINDKSAVEVFEDFLESGVWLTTDVMSQAAQLRQAGLLTDPFVLADKPGIIYEFAGDPISRSDAAFRKTVNGLLTWRGQRFMNEVNQSTEMFMRLAAFISGYERFGSKFSAVDNVMLLHFDYQDLSDAERWFKRFIPFYTWTRNNVPLQLRAAFLQQDKIRKLIVLNENIKDAFGVDGDDSWLAEVLPDYIDINGGFASTFKFAGNHLAFFPKTPIQDVDKLFYVGSILGIPVPLPRLRETAQMLGPAVTPLEFITNTNFDTGQQFRTTEDKITQMGRSLVPYIGTAQRIVSGLTIPATLAGADLSGVPFIQAERNMTNLFNLLVGSPYGATTLTEKTVTGGLIQTSIANAKQLRQAAGEAKVDVDWLRKQIRKGVTLSELRMKIARGEGNIDTLERQKKLELLTGKTKGPDKDYAQVLSQFRAGRFGGF